MCGISGILQFNEAVSGQVESILNDMLLSIAHRGPDDHGVFISESANYKLGLGHRRLSIIDIAGGKQPISNNDGSLQLVFNGEIYNYKELREELSSTGSIFSTNTDSEVILAAYERYGEKCVSKLRGMFAFAIWDKKEEKVFIARDRFGKKPLFYALLNNEIVFASEIKALLRHPGVTRELDYQAVWDYLLYRYVPGPRTFFQNVRKLPPASTMSVSMQGEHEIKQYYDLPDGRPIDELTNDEHDNPVQVFMRLLDESVKIRMVSDVPFGAFLSGGIDSSAIVGLMSRHSDTPIKTFSVGFDESNYSEFAYARTIADEFKTEHYEHTINANQLMDELPALIGYRDAPISEPSDIPIYLLSVAARKEVKMVLTGEGSDEVLGGYPKHVFERYARYYQMIPRPIREKGIEKSLQALPYKFRRAKTACLNMGLEAYEERMPGWFGGLHPSQRDNLVGSRMLSKVDRNLSAITNAPKGGSPLRNILHFDQTSWLPDNLLERGDRMTMAASLESRMPFLDHKLAEYVSALPDKFRVKGRSTKWLLRQSMLDLLPAEILNRPKVGFRVPVNEWFQSSMKDYLIDHLLGESSTILSFLDKSEISKIIEEHISKKQNHEKVLWSLLNLELWFRIYTPKC